MNILANINNDQEEKVLLAFPNSIKFNYKSGVQDDDKTILSEFLKQYNKEIDESVSDIEQGNFVLHSDIENYLQTEGKRQK